MKREIVIAAVAGVAAMLGLGVMIVVGSRNLQHFDAALVAYTFATLFAAFGLTYRYTMWLQRPPTWMYFKRGWQTFFSPAFLLRNLLVWLRRFIAGFVLNTFIWRRGRARWAAHWLIMWGCLLAVAITFPLVFGWVHFETPPNDFEHYRVFVFGFAVSTIAADGWQAKLSFHGLIWASLLVLPGVMLAMRRRMRQHDAAAVQRFGEDILPLLLLFAITVTGLLLWVSYAWMHGYGYEFLAILHAITVIFTLLWLPFGKFFHIIQRPAQLGVSFYKDVGEHSEQAECRRCGQAFASRMHVEDLITVQRQLGYRYDMPAMECGGNDAALACGGAGIASRETKAVPQPPQSKVEHYQWICPRCRRVMLALAQGRAYESAAEWSDYVQKEPTHGHRAG
ncbi:MAG: hypothetical protein WD042_02490 [Phycisphaeraceae bacterium]